MEKGSGILLHISSLPSKYGIGTFGSEARRFIRFLNKAGQKYWQILPLNPTSYGDSPYQSFSAFALNPYFIDLDILFKKGYLEKDDLKCLNTRKTRFVDYGHIYETRFKVLKKAYKKAYDVEKENINKFYRYNKKWLKDYALFMTLKEINNGKSYLEWPREQRMHKKNVLNEIFDKYQDEIKFWIYIQYEAFRQYKALKKYAKKKNVAIIGDMPIYVAQDSCDVWANSSLFLLNKEHRPTKIAGVPPDYFSSEGQLWGNPLYNWEKMKKHHYKWWKQRFKISLKLYDYIRIDHFRGFEAFYAISSRSKNAKKGTWIKGPSVDFFSEINKTFKNANVIAEDLGIIDDDVEKLLKATKYPRLKVYQFAFSDYQECLEKELDISDSVLKTMNEKEIKEAKLINPYLPHHYDDNCVAYIGTHDNDVLKNYLVEHEEEIPSMLDYLNLNNKEDIYDTLIGSLFRSNAQVCIFTMQDLLKLGKETRMNTPAIKDNNWRFRVLKKEINNDLSTWLKLMVIESKRV